MREYIPNHSVLAKPLSREVNNPVGEWPKSEMVFAFKDLTVAVSNQLNLAHLDYSVPLVIQFDAYLRSLGLAVV